MHIQTIEQALDIIKNDGLLIYPTETFFGLGCKISSEKALARIFQAKKRLLAMPLPIIVANTEQLKKEANLPSWMFDDLEQLSKNFWPGPLSIILPAKAHVSPILTGGTNKIAVRQSSHPVAQQLCELLGEPLVSSSANISGTPPTTNANELDTDFIKSVGAVLDMEPSPMGGQASTIIELIEPHKFTLLRDGAFPVQNLLDFGFTQIK